MTSSTTLVSVTPSHPLICRAREKDKLLRMRESQLLRCSIAALKYRVVALPGAAVFFGPRLDTSQRKSLRA